jgi:hypothetical protein
VGREQRGARAAGQDQRCAALSSLLVFFLCKLCADLPTALAIGAGHSFIIFLRNAVRTSAHDTAQCLVVPSR